MNEEKIPRQWCERLIQSYGKWLLHVFASDIGSTTYCSYCVPEYFPLTWLGEVEAYMHTAIYLRLNITQELNIYFLFKSAATDVKLWPI